MSKKIALVGHCGPDSSYLRMAVMQAAKGAQILMADDDSELKDVLEHQNMVGERINRFAQAERARRAGH